MLKSENVYIVEGKRLPIGKVNGCYKHIIPEVLAGTLMADFLKKYPILHTETDEIIIGCALGTGGNMARFTTLEAGFSENIPAFTIDSQCASGLNAVIMAGNQIKAGSNCVIAGGMESNSLAPKRQYKPQDERFADEKTFYTQATFAPAVFGNSSLIKAAENAALQYGISKDEMIQWTVESNKKAEDTVKNGYLNDVIFPFQNIKKDQTIKMNLTYERLLNSQTRQLIDHTNAAHLHDGACVHLLVSDQFCDQFDITPSFKLTASAIAAGSPTLAPLGVIWAVEKLFEKTGLKPDEIDLYEVNESFAVNALAFIRHFQVKHPKMNIFGGNLAYGHPFGASGAINLLHLMEAMKVKNVQKGIAAIAAAGGQGMAVLVEKI